MIRYALDWFLWGTGLAFWTIGLGGLAGSAVAALIQTWRPARAARRKPERAP
jgi:hypothetical protein